MKFSNIYYHPIAIMLLLIAIFLITFIVLSLVYSNHLKGHEDINYKFKKSAINAFNAYTENSANKTVCYDSPEMKNFVEYMLAKGLYSTPEEGIKAYKQTDSLTRKVILDTIKREENK